MKKMSKVLGNSVIVFAVSVVANYWGSLWFVANESMPKSLQNKR